LSSILIQKDQKFDECKSLSIINFTRWMRRKSIIISVCGIDRTLYSEWNNGMIGDKKKKIREIKVA